MNLANRQRPEGGLPGSATGNQRAPVTAFMAEMWDAAPQQPQGLAWGSAQAAGAAAAETERAAAGHSAAQGTD